MFKIVFVIAAIMINLSTKAHSKEPKPVEQNCKVICEKCGFYARQTQAYHEKLKSLNDSEDAYYDGMEHWMHYLYTTEKHLEVNGIEANFYASPIEKCPTLFFGEYSLEVSKIDSPFIFILYEKGKKPYVIQDIVISENEINTYFNIKNPKYPKQEE